MKIQIRHNPNYNYEIIHYLQFFMIPISNSNENEKNMSKSFAVGFLLGKYIISRVVPDIRNAGYPAPDSDISGYPVLIRIRQNWFRISGIRWFAGYPVSGRISGKKFNMSLNK